MDSPGRSGDRFAGNFRTDEPAPPIITSLNKNAFAAARIVHASSNHGISDIPPEDTFVFSYQLLGFRDNDLWVNDRPTKWEPIRAGQSHFYDLQGGIRANIKDPVDFVYMYLPRAALDDLAEEQGHGPIAGCELASGTTVDDPVVADLARSLLPALQRTEQVSQLFADHLAFTLQTHFLRNYAGISAHRAFFRGGLAPWQERLAKELMAAHLDGEVSVARLASECGLSRSHFLRAFKRSTGTTPHRWLMQSRIEQAKSLLLTTELPLGQIAIAVGFANQGHFTRAFSACIGSSPSAWRRALRR